MRAHGSAFSGRHRQQAGGNQRQLHLVGCSDARNKPAHKLWDVFTPHIGSGGRETREEMALRTVRNIERFLAGERPFDVLNPEVYGEAAVADERLS